MKLKHTFLITAGPTREYLDPVRFFSNPSSGRMGYSLARVALDRNAEVVLVTGPVDLRPPRKAKLIRVESAGEMYAAVMREYPRADVVIMAAAVADYRPKRRLTGKMKKREGDLTVKMSRTRDILAALGKRDGRHFIVGFAAETGNILKEARRKLTEKNVDMVVGNDVSRPDAGFGSDFNRGVIVERDGSAHRFPLMRKEELARLIIRRCMEKIEKE